MKKIRLISFLIVVATILLSSCDRRGQFERVEIITTTTVETTTEATTYKRSELSFRGIQLGMNIEEVQEKLSVAIPVSITERGIIYFVTELNELPFVDEGFSCNMFFLFDGNGILYEYQYITTAEIGFVLDDAIKAHDSQYGKHGQSLGSSGNMNYIWKSDGAYIVITVAQNGEIGISFFAEDYFEQYYQDEVVAYNNVE